MSLTKPSAKQTRFAGQLAWERGKKILSMPDTSSGVSALIDKLQRDFEPLATAEWQVEAFRRLVGECVARVEGFDPTEYAVVPENRSEANKAIYQLRGQLSRVAYHEAKAAAATNLVDIDADAEPGEAVETDDIPI